ncbi:hypothetical protein C8A00DRAFT_37367 [Chaetomidium leptoderma]|uniref:Rhodopsin domain-containing protein n=1 Tax=Chaetomidium leptoderma TaxID=669021 RepID=A0AAN6ZSB5_9PEZI|nr:hypothetical protein C8A00DRAFT_37367 [Chaetomidium leptoderma]
MDAFVQEAFALLGIGLFIIGLRLYVRISSSGFKRLHADDYLMVVAAVAYSIETYLAYSVGAFWKGLANNAMTDEERRLLDPNGEEYQLRVNGSKTQVAGWSTYTFLLWVIKAAMCTFFLRLTDGLGFHKRIYAGFVLIVVTWIAVLLSILFGCYPFEKNWQIYPDPGIFCQPAISEIDIFVTVVLNVLTDIYLMSIPIPMLWTSSLKPLKKAGLILLFSGGIFVTTAAILRCALIIADPINGAQKAGSWAVRETFVAVVTSNVPMISPLIARCLRPIIGSLRSTSSSNKISNKISKLTKSGDTRGRGFQLEDKNPRRGMGPRSVNPIPNFSMNGSEEHIYVRHDEDCGTTTYDTDLEGGEATVTNGGILKRTSVEVVETRRIGEPTNQQDPGDYYLKQAQQDADHLERTTSGGKRRKSSATFGIGRAP